MQNYVGIKKKRKSVLLFIKYTITSKIYENTKIYFQILKFPKIKKMCTPE